MWISSRFFVLCLLLRFGRCNSLNSRSIFPPSLSQLLLQSLAAGLALAQSPGTRRKVCLGFYACMGVCVCVLWYAHQQLSAYFVLYALRPKNLLCQKGAKAHKDFWRFNGFSPSEKRKNFGVFHVRIAYIKFAQPKVNFCSMLCV